jgi:hypothetical protein
MSFNYEMLISDLCMNEIDGCRFIEWKTRSDFRYQAEIESAVQVLSKPGICHKGVISDFDEIGLYLRVSPRLGSPQVHIAYEDIINIELL